MKTIIKNTLMIGFASLALLGCVTNQRDVHVDTSVKWEYHTEMMRQTDQETTRRLGELNSQGWVLVSVSSGNGGLSSYSFKRQSH